MPATKTFIINDKPVEMTKDECYAKFSELYRKGSGRLALLETMIKTATRNGDRELSRKYRSEYIDIKSDIDFFGSHYLNWEK